MSTFESTVVTTILQNAEKMIAKEAKWFRAGKTRSVIFLAMLRTCPHLTVGWKVQIIEISKVCIEEETALCYQSICEHCEESHTRNGPTDNEVVGL